jgi:hypothetical protein
MFKNLGLRRCIIFITDVQSIRHYRQGRRNWGGGHAGGAAAPVALYQEGQGGKRCPFNLKDPGLPNLAK